MNLLERNLSITRELSLDLWSLIVVINISSYVYKTHICKSSPLTFPYITNGLSRTTRNDDISYMKYDAGYKYYNTSGNDGENWLHLAFLPYNVFQFQVHYILFWKLLFLLLIVPHWTDMNLFELEFSNLDISTQQCLKMFWFFW